MSRIGRLTAAVVLWTFTGIALAYIPAQPTNSSSAVAQHNSSIVLKGIDSVDQVSISFQLAGSGSIGYSEGAIVHYSEYNASDPASDAPFIALISCDRNITNTTLENDIFTMANSSGAVAALLYSTTSQACLINPEYANTDEFDRVLDIYTTVSSSNAALIQSQFTGVDNSYYWYNSTNLNDTALNIINWIDGEKGRFPGPLMAIMAANASNPILSNGTSSSGGGGGSGGSSSNHSPNTSMAMIILYAITGCVCALFCIVILSGAIRAFRHPERYGAYRTRGGQHPGDDGAPPSGAALQSRAAGLGRAVLDSFPLIKFGASNTTTEPVVDQKVVDLERDGDHSMTRKPSGDGVAPGDHLEMVALPALDFESSEPGSSVRRRSAVSHARPDSGEIMEEEEDDIGHDDHPEGYDSNMVDPSAIGRDTCPICIFDFENGDDLRVLPCAGRHRFHQACVDPWLLELSSSCPICRADFGALENMAVQSTNTNPALPSLSPINRTDAASAALAHINAQSQQSQLPTNPSQSQSSPAARFSRYLRFAQNRRNRNRNQLDSTDVPNTASNTSLPLQDTSPPQPRNGTNVVML